MATDLRLLTDEEQDRHDLIVAVLPFRIQLNRRGHRWMQGCVMRRRLLR